MSAARPARSLAYEMKTAHGVSPIHKVLVEALRILFGLCVGDHEITVVLGKTPLLDYHRL
jgi:hypothetical protein